MTNKTVPNQKTVTTKGAKHDKKNLFAPLSINGLETAMNLLKPNTFKLWCYMAKNQNNYTFALSCVDACKFCGISKPTYLASVQELIEVGYLVNTNGNNYDFYEVLPEEEEVMNITVKKEELPKEFEF